jgi:hypothetical protein
MSTLKINSNNDVYFDSAGRLVMINGANSDEEIKQRVSIRLRAFEGEWFLNTDYGVPYFFDILGTKSLDLNIVESLLRIEILGVEGIKEIIGSSIDYDPNERKVSYTFQATTINNTVITDDLTI